MLKGALVFVWRLETCQEPSRNGDTIFAMAAPRYRAGWWLGEFDLHFLVSHFVGRFSGTLPPQIHNTQETTT